MPAPRESVQRADGEVDLCARIAHEVFELTRLSWLLRDRARRAGGESAELTETEYLALDALTRRQPRTVGELQRYLSVLPAQMSRVLRSLENKGSRPYIRCEINERDKRVRDVTITEAGRAVCKGFQATRVAETERIVRMLDPEDRAQFMRVLTMVRAALDKALAESSREA